jgi:hypothetical protein
MKKFEFVIIFLIICYSLVATTWTVGPSGCNFTTIQAAVNATSAGDMILVHDNIYVENIEIPIGKTNLTIISVNGPENCIISAPMFESHCLLSWSFLEKFEGFTVNGSYGGAALFLHFGAGTITKCIFEDNNNPGGYLYTASAIEGRLPIEEISDCIFFNNTGSYTVSLWVDYPLNTPTPTVFELITRNLFVGNSNTNVDISVSNMSSDYHGTIENNTFVGNNGGIKVQNYTPIGDGDIYIRNCIFSGSSILFDNYTSEGNIYIDFNCFTNSGYQNYSGWGTGNLISTNPLFCSEEPYEYYLLEGSPCIDAGDPAIVDPDGTRSDMGCFPSTTDIKSLKVDGYNWVSFPRLEREETTNEAEDIVPYLNNIYPFDDIEWIEMFHDGDRILEWDGDDWCPGNYLVKSTQAFKLDTDTVSEDDGHILPMTGTRLIPDYVIEENFGANTDYWLGYWLPETQNIVDAFGDLWQYVETVSAENWYYDKCSNNRGMGEAVPKSWITEGKNLEYGKGYVITFNDNFSDFSWTSPTSSRSVTIGYDPVETTYFSYHELPSYEVIDVLCIPDNVIEIGVYQGDVCVGAVAVQDSCEQILVYSQISGREEIPFNFKVITGRSFLSSLVLAYNVYNELTGEFVPGNVIAGRQKTSVVMFGEIGEPGMELPVINKVIMHGNYPNPFNPNTNISFSLLSEQIIELSIYNLKGQKVKRLASGNLSSGEHLLSWSGSDDEGRPVSSGLYLYKLKVGDQEFIRKMLMLK